MKPRPIPEVLTPDEQARLLAHPSGIREQAILRLFLDTGLRASELINLQCHHIDWQSGRMKVRGKGGRDRMLWVSPEDLALLKSLPSSASSGRPVFTSLDGQKPLCGRWLRKMVKRLGEQAGIKKNLHPHIFRHSFATDLLEKTKNLVLVQRALGHSNIATTTIYTHISNPALEEALKNLRNGED